MILSNKWSLMLAILATLFLGARQGWAQVSPDSAVPNCGVRSVLNLAQYMGRMPNQVQQLELCKTYFQAQVSMLDVQEAANRIGIKLEGVKATLLELEQRQQPFIAVLPNHFVFVERIEGQWVRYVEDAGLLVRPRASFEQDYQGKALVLIPSEAFNALRISPAIVAWERIPTGVLEKKATITLTNAGKTPINIENISTSCSCTVPSEWPKQIAPGQKVPLEITVHLPNSGAFAQTVTILSNAAYSNQSIWLSGTIENDVQFSPSQLNLGDVAVGKTATGSLVLSDLGRKLPRPLQVLTASPQLTAELKPQSENTWDVAVTLKAIMRPVPIDTEILVSGIEPGSRVMHIPVKANIVPMTRTRPEQAIFGSVSSATATRTLQIFRQDNQPFEIVKIAAPVFLTYEVTPSNQRHTSWILKLQVHSAQAPAQIAERLTIATQESMNGDHNKKSDEISVPVLALVEKPLQTVQPGAREAAELPRAEDDPLSRIGLPLPKVRVGEQAPDFRVLDANGNPWRLSALRGSKAVLLTFFPKCFTGGCANHLSSLRDQQTEFDAGNIQILAVSVDAATGLQGQQAFAQQWHFTFPFVPDTQRTLCKLYGATQNDDERAARMTFLIDKQGTVRFIDTQVNVSTHGPDMLAKLRELGLAK